MLLLVHAVVVVVVVSAMMMIVPDSHDVSGKDVLMIIGHDWGFRRRHLVGIGHDCSRHGRSKALQVVSHMIAVATSVVVLVLIVIVPNHLIRSIMMIIAKRQVSRLQVLLLKETQWALLLLGLVLLLLVVMIMIPIRITMLTKR